MAQLAQAGQLGLAHPPPDAIHTPVTTAEAHLQALADVEDQCASHGRHPAEWDGISQGWISTHEPAQPYAIINTSLDPPRRSREVMCELLAAGLPISRTAHQSINNAVDQKRVVKATRKLVLEGRSPHGLTPHVSAAAALGILQPHHRDFYLAVQDHLEKEELPTAAYDAVVRPLHPRAACFAGHPSPLTKARAPRVPIRAPGITSPGLARRSRCHATFGHVTPFCHCSPPPRQPPTHSRTPFTSPRSGTPPLVDRWRSSAPGVRARSVSRTGAAPPPVHQRCTVMRFVSRTMRAHAHRQLVLLTCVIPDWTQAAT